MKIWIFDILVSETIYISRPITTYALSFPWSDCSTQLNSYVNDEKKYQAFHVFKFKFYTFAEKIRKFQYAK